MLARGAVSPPSARRRTARARRDPMVSYVPGRAQAPDTGWVLRDVTYSSRIKGSGAVAVAARQLRRSTVRVEDFDLAACCIAAFDPCVGGDQGDVKGFGQGDVLSVVGGQVGMKALEARPQGQHILPFNGERAVAGERGVGFSFRDFLSAPEPEERRDDLSVEHVWRIQGLR